MLKSTARFETPNGSKYLQQLCKHFAHKVSVEYDAEKGRADLPPGPATMTADDAGLTMTVSAEHANGLQMAEFIIDDHLQRFAFREDPGKLPWVRS